jgi:hypothetical protein
MYVYLWILSIMRVLPQNKVLRFNLTGTCCKPFNFRKYFFRNWFTENKTLEKSTELFLSLGMWNHKIYYDFFGEHLALQKFHGLPYLGAYNQNLLHHWPQQHHQVECCLLILLSEYSSKPERMVYPSNCYGGLHFNFSHYWAQVIDSISEVFSW